MSLLDELNVFDGWNMSGVTKWRRLRAKPVDDAYSGDATGEDWTNPDVLEFSGSLTSSSSTRVPNGLREQTSSIAYLTVPDPKLDIVPGDRIRAVPDDGRRWEVSGYPSRDANAFTGWNPTVEIPLHEYRG